MILTELYNKDLEDYHDTGEKNHPSNLLVILLLDKKEIDKGIENVTKDFNFSKEEFIKYIKEGLGSYDEEDYGDDKLWQVFSEGFGALYWGNV